MHSYLFLARIDEDIFSNLDEFRTEIEVLQQTLKHYCPLVHWHTYYLTNGPGDVLHVLNSSDRQQLMDASSYVLTFDRIDTLMTFSTSWEQCREIFDL